jgi:hypothetical protein
MLNLISIIIGLGALFWAFIAFTPFLGALNWLVVPWALLGVGVGALSSRTSGRNFNLIVVLICVLRLWLGAGIF